MNSYDTKAISRLIRNRRSVFPAQYSGEVISKNIIEEILENANWAPTHKFTEPWRFTVFSGDGRRELGKFMSDLYKKVATEKGNFNQAKYENLRGKPLLASHVISIGMKRDELQRVPEIEEIEAVACAVQNMYLTATAHGVGCYWGSGGVTYFDEAKPYFDLGVNDKLLGFMFFGIPKSDLQTGRRKPIMGKVKWVE
jgi:nitroreductase